MKVAKSPFRFWLSLLATGLFVLMLVVAGAFWYFMFEPVDRDDSTTKTLVVERGMGRQAIGQRLVELGVLRHPWQFRLATRLSGEGSQIQAGSFQVSPNLTPAEILDRLTDRPDDVWVTIPEGLRAEEIAATFARAQLPEFDEDEFLLLVNSRSSEGRLFPDTYLIPKLYTADQIHTLLITTFERKVVQGLSAQIESSKHSFNQVLVMASLVERESRGLEEMRQVASILWRRLEIGMPLQVDATLQYVTGYNQELNTWWAPPRAADKQLRSPFNTYEVAGLPPSPIANPGLNAIKASLTPTETNYLFYIHDRSGTIHFAEDYSQHNANINRYLR